MSLASIAEAAAVRLLSMVTEAILRLLGSRGGESPPVTEEEIRVLMEQGAEAGVFEQHEHELVSRVFRLDDLRATAVLTPRTDIDYLNLDQDEETIRKRLMDAPHSRFPVTRGDLDNVEGVVEVKALLGDLARGEPLDLPRRILKPLYIPETLTATEMLVAVSER